MDVGFEEEIERVGQNSMSSLKNRKIMMAENNGQVKMCVNVVHYNRVIYLSILRIFDILWIVDRLEANGHC